MVAVILQASWQVEAQSTGVKWAFRQELGRLAAYLAGVRDLVQLWELHAPEEVALVQLLLEHGQAL